MAYGIVLGLHIQLVGNILSSASSSDRVSMCKAASEYASGYTSDPTLPSILSNAGLQVSQPEASLSSFAIQRLSRHVCTVETISQLPIPYV